MAANLSFQFTYSSMIDHCIVEVGIYDSEIRMVVHTFLRINSCFHHCRFRVLVTVRITNVWHFSKFRDIPACCVAFRYIPWYSVIFWKFGFSQRPKLWWFGKNFCMSLKIDSPPPPQGQRDWLTLAPIVAGELKGGCYMRP
jgi:hypothetical protein